MKPQIRTFLTTLASCLLVGVANGGLLTPAVVDPSFEIAGTATAPAMAEADSERGWFEARGNVGSAWAEYAATYSSNGVPDGLIWGALATGGGGRLYQKIGTVDAGATYTISGSTGRQHNQNYNQLMIELWAASGFTGADGTDLNGNATYIGGVILSEVSLFGDTLNVPATATFSTNITVTSNYGDDLWLAFADVSSLGAPGDPAGDTDIQLIDDISVSPSLPVRS